MGSSAVPRGQAGTAPSAGAASRPAELLLPGRPLPALASLLLPRHAPPGSYQLTVLDMPIEKARGQVMEALKPERRHDEEPEAWAVRRAEVLEAFGEGGSYDRPKLARLFTGRPVSILRGPVMRDGRVVASVTLLSPYPSPDFSHLEPGTVAILFLPARGREQD